MSDTKSIFYREIPDGESAPKHLGFAWFYYDRASFVAILIPFNLVARSVRSFYLTLRNPPPHRNRVFWRGFNYGFLGATIGGVVQLTILAMNTL